MCWMHPSKIRKQTRVLLCSIALCATLCMCAVQYDEVQFGRVQSAVHRCVGCMLPRLVLHQHDAVENRVVQWTQEREDKSAFVQHWIFVLLLKLLYLKFENKGVEWTQGRIDRSALVQHWLFAPLQEMPPAC